MIEVKAPGDRLQDNQRRLLEYCLGNDSHARRSVCKVRWSDSRRPTRDSTGIENNAPP